MNPRPPQQLREFRRKGPTWNHWTLDDESWSSCKQNSVVHLEISFGECEARSISPSWIRRQAEKWPGPTSFRTICDVRHFSKAYSHRGANGHPSIRAETSGGAPGMVASSAPFSLKAGIARWRA